SGRHQLSAAGAADPHARHRARATVISSAALQDAGPILVTGANGQLGRRLLRRLSRATPRRHARAVVRSQRAVDSLRDLADTGVELRVVDYRDASGLAQAAAGCDAAVHLVGILKE